MVELLGGRQAPMSATARRSPRASAVRRRGHAKRRTDPAPLAQGSPAVWPGEGRRHTTNPVGQALTPLEMRYVSAGAFRVCGFYPNADALLAKLRRGLARLQLDDPFMDGLVGVPRVGGTWPAAVRHWEHTMDGIVPLVDRRNRIANVLAFTLRNDGVEYEYADPRRLAGTMFATPRAGLRLRYRAFSDARVILAGDVLDGVALAQNTEDSVLATVRPDLMPTVLGRHLRGAHVLLAFPSTPHGRLASGMVAAAARAWGATRVDSIRWPSGTPSALAALQRLGRDAFRQRIAEAGR